MLKHIIFHRWLLESWRWFELSIYDQLWNIWSEIWRSINNKKSWNLERYNESILRAYELIDMTMADARWRKTARLKEICRLRELISDYFFWDNEYNTTDEYLEKYFFMMSVISNDERRKKREEKKLQK